MKYKTTAKAIRQYANKPRTAGYGELQHLLRGVEPTAYTCGVYGWNFDVYEIHGLTITTGYRGMVGKRLEHCTEYDKKARDILNNYNIPWDEQKSAIAELLKEFCALNGGY